jgi:hypothetical protein
VQKVTCRKKLFYVQHISHGSLEAFPNLVRSGSFSRRHDFSTYKYITSINNLSIKFGMVKLFLSPHAHNKQLACKYAVSSHQVLSNCYSPTDTAAFVCNGQNTLKFSFFTHRFHWSASIKQLSVINSSWLPITTLTAGCMRCYVSK